MAMGRVSSSPLLGMVAAAVVVVGIMLLQQGASAANAPSGYYAQTCPTAESIVYDEVKKAWNADRNTPAVLIRLFFHDCFVNGCDGSVLLESGDNQAEKNAPPNQSLGGFDVIDKAKQRIEQACGLKVSCADILAYAARDSVDVATGGFRYDVPGGRADGTVSRASQTSDLPPPNQRDVGQLWQSFAKKGLSMDDMVVLSGAHTLGVTRCGTFDYRLTNDQDKGMNSTFRNDLRRQCNHSKTNVVPLDAGSQYAFDTSYYSNVVGNRTVLESDASLNSPRTIDRVRKLMASRDMFIRDFAAAMVKMGNIHGTNPGKVRSNCRRVRT